MPPQPPGERPLRTTPAPCSCGVTLPEGRLTLRAADVDLLVFRPVVDKIIAAAKEMVEESQASGRKPVDKVRSSPGVGVECETCALG